jgi:hypothetical protein
VSSTHDEPEYPFDPKYDLHDGDFYSPEEMEVLRRERGEQPEEAKPTLKVIQNAKKRGVRRKFGEDLKVAWSESSDRGFMKVPYDIWNWVATRCQPNDVLPFTMLLCYDLSWFPARKNKPHRWGIGRWSTVERMAIATKTTVYQVRKYQDWKKKQPEFEVWVSRHGTHFRPIEAFIEVLKGKASDGLLTEPTQQQMEERHYATD